MTLSQVNTVVLHGNATEVFCPGNSFLLTSLVWQLILSPSPTYGAIRPLLLLALTSFTVGSMIRVVPQNFTMMLVSRSIQGAREKPSSLSRKF